jgi:hypothetical protein
MRKSRLSEEQIIAIIKVWIGTGIGPPPSALNSLIRREFLLFDDAPVGADQDPTSLVFFTPLQQLR